jgi:hypothetical protein
MAATIGDRENDSDGRENDGGDQEAADEEQPRAR